MIGIFRRNKKQKNFYSFVDANVINTNMTKE